VNVSPRQLDSPGIVTDIAEALEESGLEPRRLVIEITESTLIRDPGSTVERIAKLKTLGVSVAVDDFGTGYSSLAYLRRFPVDQLKVDRGLVQDVAEHGDTRIMGAVVRLAHDLGLDVVAEGVENESERSVVRTLGCDSMQGYLLGRPVPPHSIEQSFASGLTSAVGTAR